MKPTSLRRSTVALIAAYAMALQALVAAFVPIAPVSLAGPLAVLCSSDGGGTGQPLQHDLPCAAICAALGHGVAGPVPSGVAVARSVSRSGAAVTPVTDWVPPRIAVAGPQAPRGPPLA